MATAVKRSERARRRSPNRPKPHARDRRSPPRRRSSPPPPPMDSSPSRRARSPSRRAAPPESARDGGERSPSPRTKRLRRAQAERDSDRAAETKDRIRAPPRDREEARERTGGGGGGHSRASRRDRDRERSASPEEREHRGRRGSRSPARASKPGAHDEEMKSRATENSKNGDDAISKMKAAEESLQAKEKQKPSFELSGKLAEETNRVKGVTLLFNEPSDARKPEVRWRLYVFKAGEVQKEPLYIHRQSCYLFGRERRVADVPTDHPSCSKQHAVLQYRLVEKEQPDGLLSKQVRPYLMDIGSTNGTFINDNRLDSQRYYELFEKDTIKFGNSSREYVMLHENSSD